MKQPLVSDLIARPVRRRAYGTVAAPIADVAGLLLAVRPGRVSYENGLVLVGLPEARTGQLTIEFGAAPGCFHVVGARDHIDLFVDRAIPALAISGRFGTVYTVRTGHEVSHVVHGLHTAPPEHVDAAGTDSMLRTALAQVIRVIADTLDVEGTIHRERTPVMSIVRVHRYTVDPDDVEELVARRTDLIKAIRANYPGLSETRLTRFEDGTFTDAWRWESAERMQAAFPAMQDLPEAGAAMSMVRDATAQNGQIVDEQ